MTCQTFHLSPQVFKDQSAQERIRVYSVHETSLQANAVSKVLSSTVHGVLGIAAEYGTKCSLTTLAIASLSDVLVIKMQTKRTASEPGKKKKGKKAGEQRNSLVKDILFTEEYTKVAFNADRLATSLFLDYDLRLANGLDLLSFASPRKNRRDTMGMLYEALGGTQYLNEEQVTQIFNDEGQGASAKASQPCANVALRAWVAGRTGVRVAYSAGLSKILRINTTTFTDHDLFILAKLRRDADRLDALKPTLTRNDVSANVSLKKGTVTLQSERFRTRLRRSLTQTLIIHAKNGDAAFQATGRVRGVNGKQGQIQLHGKASISTVSKVITIGKEEATSAEQQRLAIILRALHRSSNVLSLPFFVSIWKTAAKAPTRSIGPAIPIFFPQRPLNESQKRAVMAILDPTRTLTTIQGPPGSGKTTVIAAAVTSFMKLKKAQPTLWLVAQSNVAVKNIAEKLASVDFLQFKLLVSHEFHFDWHEHLYEKIEPNVIRSDTLGPDAVQNERILAGSRVVLCTLTMIGNERLRECGLTRVVPIETVIVDEASQIEVGDYLPLIVKFAPTLKKLVFIGDDCQLPPYGREQVETLQSVFEMPHIRDEAIFLDTQYRMPLPVGNFISRHVYAGRLKSVHTIKDQTACRFIDVVDGSEGSHGHSWTNHREMQITLHIVRRYTQKGMPFRIITPYDAQRTKLENALKDANLPWKDKVFNVDSFQGNEEDHIIISLVRTKKIGFLNNQRRTNVMLSRCKKSMVIVTQRAFLEEKAAKTLVGKLAAEWGDKAWTTGRDVIAGRF